MTAPRVTPLPARGQVYHRFHGTYGAVVVLRWGDPSQPSEDDAVRARQALAALNGDEGGPWVPSRKNADTLVASCDSAGLALLEAQLRRLGNLEIERCGWSHCADQCRAASIGGIPHSIDVGPAFRWLCTAPKHVDTSEQLNLL